MEPQAPITYRHFEDAMTDYNSFVVAELVADRCPVAGDSQHRWMPVEPPEYMPNPMLRPRVSV
jgi:hypothetical protein